MMHLAALTIASIVAGSAAGEVSDIPNGKGNTYNSGNYRGDKLGVNSGNFSNIKNSPNSGNESVSGNNALGPQRIVVRRVILRRVIARRVINKRVINKRLTRD
ncbi:hypothetical protein [Herbidospora mongoliensis]|uniref:hypothetical protein n=1 Tax=Herbidospora mongoliensis TaxID=688067 RepID=UPI0012FBE497|nr:hypothetical protein [Herbidospora mongoliensis]